MISFVPTLSSGYRKDRLCFSLLSQHNNLHPTICAHQKVWRLLPTSKQVISSAVDTGQVSSNSILTQCLPGASIRSCKMRAQSPIGLQDHPHFRWHSQATGCLTCASDITVITRVPMTPPPWVQLVCLCSS